MKPVVFCDFDGTITSLDTIVYLTEHAGTDPGLRHQAFEKILSGEWSVYQAIEVEMRSVCLSWQEAVALLTSNIHIDPFFEGFVAWARASGLDVRIVSSGMQPVVDLFVGHLALETYAHPVEIRSDGWRYRPDPLKQKVRVLRQARSSGAPLIYVGDGTSDVCALPFADQVFATKYLAHYCEEHGIVYCAFESFADVQAQLGEWLIAKGE